MRRALLIALIALAAPEAARAEPVVIARGDGGLDAYLRGLDGAEADLEALCAELEGDAPDGRFWVRGGAGGLEIAPAAEAAPEALAFWARAVLGARKAAAAAYGEAAATPAPGAALMIEKAGGALTVFDGAARRAETLCDAIRAIAAALGPARTGAGAATAGDIFAEARSAAAERAPIALARGAEMTAEIAGLPEGGALSARGPDGVSVALQPGEDGAALLSLRADAGAVAGPGLLRFYTPSDPFRAVAETEITVLPGAAETPAPTGPLRLTPGAATIGAVGPGEAAVLAIEIEADRRVAIRSEGEFDLAATLETEAGATIASADDHGAGYGFSMEVDLAPGLYRLRVAHCCGGSGAFSITADAP